MVRKGNKVALIGAGSMFPRMAEAADILAANGVEVTLINPRSVTYLDTATLSTLSSCDIVITAEDGIVDGGFGQKIAAFFAQPGASAAPKVECLGLPKEFIDRYNPSDLLAQCGLEPRQIAERAMGAIR